MKKLIFALTLVAVANFAYGSNLNAQGLQPAVVDSPIKNQRKLDLPIQIQRKATTGESNRLGENFRHVDPITKGYDLSVYIKGTHHEGKFIIITKDGFANKDIERAIVITALEQHGAVASSQKEKYNVAIEDEILYYKYKETTDNPEKIEFYHCFNKYRRILRLSKAQMEKEKLLPFDFTYYELIDAVEKLVYKDELKLAGDTISVKNRIFKELPDNWFKKPKRTVWHD
jgi:co-chaperonin GroES (HSP10)